jgi:hypothetical protein
MKDFIVLTVLIVSFTKAQESTTLIQRTTNSVDIQICVQGSVLSTQRSDFQKALLQYLQDTILSTNAVYLERQYTTLQSGDLCFLYVYQAPNTAYSLIAVQRFSSMTDQLIHVPFTFATSGANVLIPCKVDAAQWNGDDLTYLGTPFPAMWKVNDLLLWGSCILSLLFVCMSALCCYALCTKISPITDGDSVVKMDKEILSILKKKKPSVDMKLPAIAPPKVTPK